MPEVYKYHKKIQRILEWVEGHPQYDNAGLVELLEECGDIEHDPRSVKDRATQGIIRAKVCWTGSQPPTWRETIAALRAILATSKTTPPA